LDVLQFPLFQTRNDVYLPPPQPVVGTAISGADGRFVINGLKQGRFSLTAYSNVAQVLDMHAIEFTLADLEDKAIDLPAHPFCVVSGRVLQLVSGKKLPVKSSPVYLDLNGNARFDANEPKMRTGSWGDYSFGHVRPGSYTVRSLGNHLRVISSLPAGNAVAGTAFNLHPMIVDAPLTSVNATAFLDRNRNGIRDRFEPLAQRINVHVDLNDNGLEDRGESSEIRLTRGKFNITVPFGQTRISFRTPDGEFFGRVVYKIEHPVKHDLLLIGLKPARAMK
jgi:hypothetical protein